MIVGADGADDATILTAQRALYAGYGLKRVYYSAFSPIPDASAALPLVKPPLLREHRLYQADWLMRFYGFDADEIARAPAGMLDLDDRSQACLGAGASRAFPLDVNRAPREMLLRVPGFGTKTVDRILAARRQRRLRYDDLARLGALMERRGPSSRCPAGRPAG